MATRERPISPFLTYRWQYTNTLSILNRLTGVVLTIGIIPLIYWLIAAAGGREAYLDAVDVLGSPIATFMMVGCSFSFFFHLLNGVRHLAWDAGWGFELSTTYRTGWAVLIVATVLSVVAWGLGYWARGAF